jgi:outer membrane protein assembly factor BamB
MSRTFIIFLLVFIATAGAGIAWFYLRPRPNQYDVAAKVMPDLPAIKVAAGDWPWWRGPSRDNHSSDATCPTEWSERNNIVWKTAIPGRGHSSPIVSGQRVFVTSADENVERQFVVALDRGNGSMLWEKTLHDKNFPAKHADNSHASSTPATDGTRLFVVFANNQAIHVTALDFTGQILWQKEAGPHGGGGSHGYGSSPALWGPYVFVNDDTPAGGWIAALNRETGDIGWRMTRRTGMGSYGSPNIWEPDGKPMVVLVGNGGVSAYAPRDGHILWEQTGLGEASGNTATTSPNLVFASSGYPRRNLIALRGDGTVAWKKENKDEFPYPPSMLWNDKHLFIVSDSGMATCYQADTGELKWKERLKGGYYSSPLLVGGEIYACGRNGETEIFKASPNGFVETAHNKLDDGINASPAACGGQLFIRTEKHLYCIGKK